MQTQPNRVCMTTALERLKMDLRAKGCSESTVKTYGVYAGVFLKTNGQLDCADLSWATLSDVNRFLAMYSGRERATQKQVADSIRALFKANGRRDWTEIPQIRVPRKSIRILSDDEVLKLLYAAKSKRDVAMIYLAYATGMRISELLGLDMRDIDLERRLIHIRHAKGGDERIVPFDETAQGLLREYLASEPPRMPEQPLFLSRGGRRLSSKATEHLLHEAALRAGLITPSERGRITWHKLRHTFATQMMDQIGIFRVAKLLGHRSLATTERYLHADLEDLRSAYDRARSRLGIGRLAEKSH